MTTSTGAVPLGRDRATSRAMVGREAELDRLASTFAQAAADQQVATVLLEGPAGIGKTRLVGALAQRVHAEGGEVLIGRCIAQGGEVLPYAPVVEMLADLVRREGARTVQQWAGPTGSELGRLVPSLLPDAAEPDPRLAHALQLFQSVGAVLERLARRSPTLVVVEDLQWADRSTRELLALLVEQLRGPVLVLLTMRTDERPQDPGIARFVAEQGRRRAQRVELSSLTRAEQARQLSHILGVPPPPQLLHEVYTRAEGNPFFAEELLALGRPSDMPTTVRDLLLVRLEALAPATRQVLRTAAAVGRRIPHALLEAVSETAADRLDDALREAVDAHVLVSVPEEGVFSFRHALLQEAVAGSLLPGEAARMHRRVAEALVGEPGLAGTTAFAAGAIARHWHAAGDTARAFTASLAAAEEARQALAFSESLSHYERVVELLDVVPDADQLLPQPRYWVLWAAAEVAHLAAAPVRAAELVRAAIAVVDLDRPDHHGYLQERLGRYLWMNADGEGAMAAYENAVRLVPSRPPSRWRVAALSGYSQMLMLAGHFSDSERYAREAIAMAAGLPDCRSLEGHARNNLGVDLGRLGHYEAGLAELQAAKEIAEQEFEDVDDIGRAIVNLHSVHLMAGRLREAADVAVEGLEVIDRLGLRRRKGGWCRAEAAHALLQLGLHDEAMRLLDEAADLDPMGVDAVWLDVVRGTLLTRLGRFDDAVEVLGRAYAAGARLLDGQLVGPLYAAMAELAGWQGDGARAEALAREGVQRLLLDGDPTFSVGVCTAAVFALVDAAVGRHGRPGHREATVEAVDGWLTRSTTALHDMAAEGRVQEACHATALAERSRLVDASDPGAWADARERWEAVGDPGRAAYAGIREGEALLASRAQRAAAKGRLQYFSAQAEQLGMPHLSRLASEIADRARIPLAETADPAPADRFHLTRREREVLALVAEGMTDRDIGARLFISPRTVERHVSNLLAKLDARRRAELTALAIRWDLVNAAGAGATTSESGR